jgi:Beta-lactamase class C and other penicillin binding proteins
MRAAPLVGARRTRRRGLASAFSGAVAMALAVGLALSGCTSSGAPAAPTQAGTDLPKQLAGELDAALSSAMKLAGASGAIAGVWAPWSGSWIASPGTTTVGGSDPMTADMSFRIGSLTKPMTCTVLLRLVDEGVVKLDDPVSKYLPRIVGVHGVTLGQLCQNTSGLADYDPGVVAQVTDNPTRQWVPMELMSDGLAQPATAAPGGTWSYSNPGFILLGMALQSATGEDWQQLYAHYVFGPLHLQSSRLPDAGTVTLPPPSPRGYATELDPATAAAKCGSRLDDTELSPSSGWTAGGVVSNLADLKAFAQAFASGRPFSKASAKALWTTTPMPGSNSSWQSYGLGGVQLGPFRGHDGATPGFITSMLSDPKSGLTVVVMLNNSTSGADFAQLLSMQLASIAAQAPAVSGKKAPTLSLPWSSAQAATGLESIAVCPPKPAKGAKPTPKPSPAFTVPQPDN